MLRRRVVRDDATDVDQVDDVAERRAVAAPVWSPAQIVALAAGLFMTVVGALALVRTGIHVHDMTRTVNGPIWRHTTWLGVAEVVFGVLMLGAGAVPGAVRGSMRFLGLLAAAFGIAVLVQPSTFTRTMGTHQSTGWVYVIVGGACVLAAMVSPTFFARRESYARTRRHAFG